MVTYDYFLKFQNPFNFWKEEAEFFEFDTCDTY